MTGATEQPQDTPHAGAPPDKKKPPPDDGAGGGATFGEFEKAQQQNVTRSAPNLQVPSVAAAILRAERQQARDALWEALAYAQHYSNLVPRITEARSLA